MTKKLNTLTDLKSLGSTTPKQNLLVTKDAQSAKLLHQELEEQFHCLLLEGSELLPYDFFSSSPMIRASRLSCLSELIKHKEHNLIVSVQTLMSPCPDITHVMPINQLKVGDKLDLNNLLDLLTKNGYSREDFVSVPGEYALRGSILDVFLTSKENPIRIEFFGNDIETLRIFDPQTQISNKKILYIDHLPSFEYPINEQSANTFKDNWRLKFNVFEGDSELFNRVMSKRPAEGIEIYLPLFFGRKTSLLPFIVEMKNIFIQEGVTKEAKIYETLITERYEEYRYDQKRPLLPPSELFIKYDNFLDFVKDKKKYDFKLNENIENINKEKEVKERNEKSDINLQNMPILDDLVVHLTHGIGRFKGLKQIDTFIGVSDCLEIEYAENSRVYVPIEHMHLVSRYFGPKERSLDFLGSKRWVTRKDKALKQTFDTAAELLEVQAKRSNKKGFSYEIPIKEYQEFCSKFPYQETFDQKRTIDEVVVDMQKPIPMDRLICGEVGFGKTEVIMRAAFIAAFNQKQTCVLVPTTLLATQHFSSFLDRFDNTGIEIKVLSRNIQTKEKEDILKNLVEGNIDILIGTHAVLQNYVKFFDLGLLVIDEEHRFGVRQKEKIKSLKEEVEIISLSATPIPRSLNFALTELKDLSIIATAPDDRLPVKTFAYSFNENLIHEAIQRESLRNGQTYYLCNDLKLIADRQQRLKSRFPDLSIEIVHGQLDGKEIEKKMISFHAKKIDVLVCSTIIESGIDVSNANTLIVEDADKLGLAQLHQLRGRIGRSDKQAYAYFLRSRNLIKRKAADKRLEALQETDSLSAGFLLALKDLEIRGAGEILGSNQSGVFDSIGLDLYTRMIKKATDFIKNGDLDFHNLDELPEINMNKSCLIPEKYLPDINVRLLMYNRIALAQSNEDLQKIQVEMINRFGLLPDEIKHFFLQAELRLLSEENSVIKINFIKDKINVFFKNSDLDTSIISNEDIESKVNMTKDVIKAIVQNVN